MKKYYQVLGLEEGATKEEIQDAFKKLSLELDPKNNDDQDFFKEEYALLQQAYEKLMGYAPDECDNDSLEKKVETQNPAKNTDKLPKSNDKKKKIIFSLAVLSVVVIIYLFYTREVMGCMDPTAFNYNPKANTSAKCIPIIKGCTDPQAINYNSEPNVMLDHSCVKVVYKDNTKSSLIYFDLAKYKDVSYDFIYNISDTISDTRERNYSNDYTYRNIIINKIDTISYTPYNVDENHLSSKSFPQGNRIKVIEYLSGKRKKTHYINISEGEYLLNPLSYYKYKFEEAQYGSLALGFGSGPNYRKGFLVLLEDKINYWFEDFPSTITVQQYEYSLDLYYRYNIKRYR